MLNYQVTELEESFVIRFGTEHSRINAYTLASTLVSIADASKAANSEINPGYDIEVVVESLGAGSFKAKVRAVYRKTGNLFSRENVKAVILGVIGNYIYQVTVANDPNLNLTILTDEVIIQVADKTVVVPRQIYDATKSAEKLPNFTENVSSVFSISKNDNDIEYLEIRSESEERDSLESVIHVPREKFGSLVSVDSLLPDEPTRIIEEATDLQIIKAIFERGRRKWEFAWRGVRISAPVLDQNFFADFSERKITLAAGDGLQVKLRIIQHLNEGTGVYTNANYEVIEVTKHIPKYIQQGLC